MGGLGGDRPGNLSEYVDGLRESKGFRWQQRFLVWILCLDSLGSNVRMYIPDKR